MEPNKNNDSQTRHQSHQWTSNVARYRPCASVRGRAGRHRSRRPECSGEFANRPRAENVQGVGSERFFVSDPLKTAEIRSVQCFRRFQSVNMPFGTFNVCTWQLRQSVLRFGAFPPSPLAGTAPKLLAELLARDDLGTQSMI